jgi:hypothetical protein
MAVVCVAVAFGCAKPTPSLPTDVEAAVREKFAELQTAIKNGDTDKIWALMDGKSRADAERVARDIQTALNTTNSEETAKQEMLLGLSGTELSGLTGPGILKTKGFHKKYHELTDSTIEKVAIQGESVTVHYLEPDGDHEKLIFVRQDGQWKVWLAIPKATLK